MLQPYLIVQRSQRVKVVCLCPVQLVPSGEESEDLVTVVPRSFSLREDGRMRWNFLRINRLAEGPFHSQPIGDVDGVVDRSRFGGPHRHHWYHPTTSKPESSSLPPLRDF
ncbi:hypothetical protein GWK47_048962 [Chionoecetes opilio]|uniref:Uncharacterized protein n=1 Tax=Chionoecetes opilio TaxID=41210 RepID=A0A8J5CUF6_CHIOP|nr:hypothetical protein GWK47_048962 [Chionoecetes opilio]